MRSLISFGLSFVISLATTAQITVEQKDFANAGDSIIIAKNASVGSISVGGSGMQTWDFSALDTASRDTIIFEKVTGGSFPNADFSVTDDSKTAYYGSNSALLYMDGLSGDFLGRNINLDFDFIPGITQLTFPSTYQTSFIDTFLLDTIVSCSEIGLGTLCDSTRLKRSGFVYSDIDGYGELKLPGETYSTLRQHFVEDYSDTIWNKLPFVGWQPFLSSDTVTHTYRWLANNEKWPVLTAIADQEDGNILSASFIFKVSKTSDIKDVKKANPYRLYPNPTNTTLTIETEKQIDQVRVYGLLGTLVHQESNLNGKKHINVSHLSPGFYTIVLAANGSESCAKFTIER